jgi:hypothetical protein
MGHVRPLSEWPRQWVLCVLCDTMELYVAEEGSFPQACTPCIGQLHYNFWHLWRTANETDRTA